MRWMLLLLLVLLDARVVTPWLLSVCPAAPGVERALWPLLIPLIMAGGSAVGGWLAGRNKDQPTSGSGGGADVPFDWGAASPYLQGMGSAMRRSGSGGALGSLLQYQQQRMTQSEPLNQTLLAMASEMLPTHVKVPGGAVDQWRQQYVDATRRAQIPPTGNDSTRAQNEAFRRG